MKVTLIGGTGHIGTFLTRQLLDAGDEVTVVSSGRKPVPNYENNRMSYVKFTYADMFADGSFEAFLKESKTDAVVDILQGNTSGLYNACLASGVGQVVVCGSLWMFGRPKVVPTPEITQTPCPFDGYQSRYNDMLSAIELSKKDGISFSAVMPPNICGPGKIPLEGMGGRSIEVHRAHRRGEEVVLPFPGTNLVGPCDADDVARVFFCALKNSAAAAGEIFNAGSAYALTAEKFISTYADIHNTRIPVRYVSCEEYVKDISPNLGANYHFTEHMCPDIRKARQKIGYNPLYTSEQAMERAVRWMLDQGLLK
ncbi:MAG: NAD(P)-dependent oxidoreductase [Armatimonadota bacterium]